MNIVIALIGTILSSFFSSMWNKIFPAKTAADQKAEDLTVSVKEAVNANKVSCEVDQKSRADVNADLAKFVRNDE
jgi:1,4-dihydroxy-2-naphthoate octaprenyltransferase